jgi:hypothetical protein
VRGSGGGAGALTKAARAWLRKPLLRRLRLSIASNTGRHRTHRHHHLPCARALPCVQLPDQVRLQRRGHQPHRRHLQGRAPAPRRPAACTPALPVHQRLPERVVSHGKACRLLLYVAVAG